MSYFLVFLVVILTAYGQLVLKWRVIQAGNVPSELEAKFHYFAGLLIQPWVLSVYLSILISGVCWMAALSRLQLSHAYPFISGSFVLVLILSGVFFQEPINVSRVAGVILILLGIVIGSQG